MSEAMVALGVAETVQGGNPQRKALCLRCQGKGIICIWDWVNTSTPQGRKQITNFKCLYLSISKELMKIIR